MGLSRLCRTKSVELISNIKELYNFHKDDILGEGAYSVVYKGTRKTDAKHVALKIISLNQDELSEHVEETMTRELELMISQRP